MKAKLKMMLAMFIFGTGGLLAHFIPLPSSVLALSRGVIGVIFLLAVIYIGGKKVNWRAIKNNLILLIVLGSLLGVNWLLQFEAYKHTSIAISISVYYIAPIIVTLVSPFFLKEKLSAVKLACVFVSLAGMLLVSNVFTGQNVGDNMTLGIILSLIAALMYAAIIIGNKFLKNISGIDSTVAQLGISAIALLPYVLIAENFSAIKLTTVGIILMLVMGLVHTGFSYLLYFGSMQELKGQTVAIFSYIDPVTSILLSTLVLREPMGGLQILGAVLILSATFLSEIFGDKKLFKSPLGKNKTPQA